MVQNFDVKSNNQIRQNHIIMRTIDLLNQGIYKNDSRHK